MAIILLRENERPLIGLHQDIGIEHFCAMEPLHSDCFKKLKEIAYDPWHTIKRTNILSYYLFSKELMYLVIVYKVTPQSVSSRQKINKETQASNDTLDQLDLIDTCKMFHPIIVGIIDWGERLKREVIRQNAKMNSESNIHKPKTPKAIHKLTKRKMGINKNQKRREQTSQ